MKTSLLWVITQRVVVIFSDVSGNVAKELLYSQSSSSPPFSLFPQHHVWKLSRYFWSAFRSVSFAAPFAATFQMYHFTRFFFKFKTNLLAKIVFLILNTAFAKAILDLVVLRLSPCLECSLCSFGNIPGVWSLKADVSELNVSSIVLGDQDDGTDIEFRNVGF